MSSGTYRPKFPSKDAPDAGRRPSPQSSPSELDTRGLTPRGQYWSKLGNQLNKSSSHHRGYPSDSYKYSQPYRQQRDRGDRTVYQSSPRSSRPRGSPSYYEQPRNSPDKTPSPDTRKTSSPAVVEPSKTPLSAEQKIVTETPKERERLDKVQQEIRELEGRLEKLRAEEKQLLQSLGEKPNEPALDVVCVLPDGTERWVTIRQGDDVVEKVGPLANGTSLSSESVGRIQALVREL